MKTFYQAPETFVPGSKTLPGRYYTTPEILTEEFEKIFFQRWLCVGREEQIQDPGDYFLVELGQESLIVLRDRIGRVNSFYNLCRHRGTRMCTQERGRFPASIQCPYHAWTYSLDGKLIGAPLMDEVDGFDKARYSLQAVEVVCWEGFLWVNLAPQPEAFETAFAPLAGKFDRWKLQNLRIAKSILYDVRANWKLIVQNYSECYHCPLIHPDLSRISPYRSGQNDLFEGPFLGGYMEINPGIGSLTLSGRTCALPLGEVCGDDLERVYYYSIFPNMLLSLHPDYVMVHTLWPQEPGRTQILCQWLFSAEAFEQPGFDPEDAAGFWDMTNRQDWQVCELSQLGVGSRAYIPSPYSAAESLLAAFDRELLRSLGHG